MYRINFSEMDVGTPGREKNMFRRLLSLEGIYTVFGPRPPRGPGGGGVLFAAFVTVLTFKATEKAIHSLGHR
jgi:hypothetical protein